MAKKIAKYGLLISLLPISILVYEIYRLKKLRSYELDYETYGLY